MSRERSGWTPGSRAGRPEGLSDEELCCVPAGATPAQDLTAQGETAMVETYFNPKEISVDNAVPWQRKK